MSKKTFSAAPKPPPPSAEAIDAFENGGPGHDTNITTKQGTHIPTNTGRATVRTPGAGEAEPTKRLSLDLPLSLHRRFKTACSATDSKMIHEIMQFIERRTAELERQAGINQ